MPSNEGEWGLILFVLRAKAVCVNSCVSDAIVLRQGRFGDGDGEATKNVIVDLSLILFIISWIFPFVSWVFLLSELNTEHIHFMGRFYELIFMRVTRWFMVDSEEESSKNQMQVNDLFQCLCTWLSKLEDTRWVVTTARDVRIEVVYPRYNTTF